MVLLGDFFVTKQNPEHPRGLLNLFSLSDREIFKQNHACVTTFAQRILLSDREISKQIPRGSAPVPVTLSSAVD